MIRTTIIAAAGLALIAGCSTQPQQAPLVPATFTAPTPHITIPPDPLDALAPGVRSAYLHHDTEPVRDGFAWIFPYQPHEQITVYSAPRHLTAIEISPNEHIVSASAADSARWAFQIYGNRIVVKPVPEATANGASQSNPQSGTGPALIPSSAFSSNAFIESDKRTYAILLQSGSLSHAMELVTYWYPDDIAAAEATRTVAMHKAAQLATSEAPDQLNFAYKISGPSVSWKPTQVYSDNSHTYIEFASDALTQSDMPTLYTELGNNRELVNYQVDDTDHHRFVVDRLFQSAALTSGIGSDRNTVYITRQ